MAIALRVTEVEEDDPTGRVRMKPFCKNMTFSERQMMVYRVVLVFVQYFTPLCVISFVYSRMALRLWGSRAPGNAQDSRDANLMKNKKKNNDCSNNPISNRTYRLSPVSFFENVYV
ncbi:hypothetical protein LSTR_LSTR014937 [Laodelphax striatellus]|uniref:G-protein coupled receptors family 1 profile domain-containing protein n=1 Tax=Laodelphax striatellus TaxID=195883 RepID=A0A482X905_LAOST|nr:hypothetical protein LSTR_LSTR014937 [Laodelphax striatellus]